MSSFRTDPLLGAAQTLTILIRIVVIFAMVMIGIGIGALLSVEHAGIMSKIADTGAPEYAFWLLVVAMVLIIALLALAYRFFTELTGIVASVAAGDPFHTDNADRLTRMGWIALAGQGLGLVIGMIAGWFEPFAQKTGQDVDVGFGMDVTGILLVLVLFILARVFRHGAALREDLEGTV